jgi:hypothetical protein
MHGMPGVGKTALVILIVLDNVTDERQVRPLLPGPGGGSAVLIASRSALLGLDATTRTHLDVLDPARALALLTRLAGPERVAAEPAAAADIARLSGGPAARRPRDRNPAGRPRPLAVTGDGRAPG